MPKPSTGQSRWSSRASLAGGAGLLSLTVFTLATCQGQPQNTAESTAPEAVMNDLAETAPAAGIAQSGQGGQGENFGARAAQTAGLDLENAWDRTQVEAALQDRPDDPALRLQAARLDYFAAAAGDQRALARAAAQLEGLRQQRPDDPVVAAYLGSVRTLQARQALMPWDKGKRMEQGAALLNQAVADAPDHAEVRYLRAITAMNLPTWMKQRQQAAADFRWLAQRLMDGPPPAPVLPPFMVASALLHHGELMQEAGDSAAAVAAWQRAIELAPDTPAAEQAQQRLEALDRKVETETEAKAEG